MKDVKQEFESLVRIIKTADMEGIKFVGMDRFNVDNQKGKLSFSLTFEQDCRKEKVEIEPKKEK